MTDSKQATLVIRTLGPFGIEIAGVKLPDEAWPRRKTKELFKVLLTAPGEVFSADRLIDVLLPNSDPERARSNIRARVSELRALLECNLARGVDSQYVKRVGEGYCFSLQSSCWLDSVAFAQMLSEGFIFADRGDWTSAAEKLDSAVTLYQGEFLSEDRYEEWAKSTRQQLREKHLDGLARLAHCYAELGRLRQAITCCQEILRLEPHREQSIRELMEYHDAAGHREQALDTYSRGQQVLKDYMDIDPAPETRALFERIKSGSARQTKLDPRRIAVLPFSNYSPDPEDQYLADGMTEELIGCISKVRDFRVIARTSVMRFKDTVAPIAQVAGALQVGSVLEGSVRRAGDRIRISAQLIDSSTEEHLWASEYEIFTSEILSAQCEVAREVASALTIELLPEEKAQLGTNKTDAPSTRKLCVKGRFFFEKGYPAEIQKGVRCFQQALDLAPDHAPAYAGLALCYTHLMESLLTMDEAHKLARQAASRALELDVELAEAHTAMGLIRLVFELDPEGAEQSFRRAAQLNPSYAPAHLWQGFRALWISAFEEAIIEFRNALELDPLAPYSYFMLSRPLAALNRFPEAFDALEKSLEIDPAHLSSLGRVHVYKLALWDWKEAEEIIRKLDHHGFGARARLYRMFLALYQGDCAESLREASGWLEYLVPNGPSEVLWGHMHLQEIYLCTRDYEHSLVHMEECLQACPSGNGPFDMCKLFFHGFTASLALGRFEEAASLLRRATSFIHGEFQAEWGASVWVSAAAGMLHAAVGETGAAHKTLEQLRRLMPHCEAAAACAVLSFELGKADDGFKWLNHALDNHDRFLLRIKTHPWFDPARDDARFADVLQRMHLAD